MDNSTMDWCPLYSIWRSKSGNYAMNMGRVLDLQSDAIVKIKVLDLQTEQLTEVQWADWSRWRDEGKISRVKWSFQNAS